MMKSMRSKRVLIMLFGLTTASVYAQIPVTITSDIPATMHQIEIVAQWANQLELMRRQYDTLRQQYESITGSYRRGEFGLSASINSTSIVPGSWQEVVAQQQNGAYGSGQQNTERLIRTMPPELFRSPGGQDASTYKLSTDSVRAAMTGGDVLYAQVQTNLNNLTAMARQVDTTTNTKDAADLQNRIATENGMLQSAMAKLNVMNINLQANMLNQHNQSTSINQQRYRRAGS